MSVDELVTWLRWQGSAEPNAQCTTAADLIAALMAEREAWHEWRRAYDSVSVVPHDHWGDVQTARARVDEIIGRIGK